MRSSGCHRNKSVSQDLHSGLNISVGFTNLKYIFFLTVLSIRYYIYWKIHVRCYCWLEICNSNVSLSSSFWDFSISPLVDSSPQVDRKWFCKHGCLEALQIWPQSELTFLKLFSICVKCLKIEVTIFVFHDHHWHFRQVLIHLHPSLKDKQCR